MRTLAILVDASIKGALVLLVAGLLSLVLRRASAALRHLIWSAAVVGVLLLPLLSWFLPAWRLAVLPPGTPVWPMATSPVETVSLPPSEPAVSVPTIERRAVQGPGRGALLSHRHWSTWALLAWAGGALAILGYQLSGVFGVWRLRRSSTPITSEGWDRLVRDLAAELGVRRPVTLFGSGRAVIPLTWGIWRPAILLPANRETWPEDRRRIVLLHELAHVKRLDLLTQRLERLATAVYWFNPLVWLSQYHLRVERERACDDCVLRAGGKASDYASLLLETARECGIVPPASLAAIPMARPFKLEGRLRAILEPNRNRGSLSRLAWSVILLGASAVLLPLGAARLSARAEAASDSTTNKPAPQAQTSSGQPANSSATAVSPLDASQAQRLAEMRSAVGANDLAKMKTLLQTNPELVNVANNIGETLLGLAVSFGEKDMVGLLLAHGADVRVKGREGKTPLQWAVVVGRQEILDLLLRKVDINVKDQDGETLLHQAAEVGKQDMVEYLLARGADVHARDKDGNTPLHTAALAFGGHPAVVKLLLAHGAKVEDIYLAAALGMTDQVAQFLVRTPSLLNAQDRAGYLTPLHAAAVGGHQAIVELLLAKGADPNAKATRTGTTPLFLAAALGRKDVAALLLARGADVNGGPLEGGTPLHAAAGDGHKDVVELLLANGADVNAKTTHGLTPLHSAAIRCHQDVAELLLAKGADVNALSQDGKTPLGIALEYSRRFHGFKTGLAADAVADILRQHGGKE